MWLCGRSLKTHVFRVIKKVFLFCEKLLPIIADTLNGISRKCGGGNTVTFQWGGGGLWIFRTWLELSSSLLWIIGFACMLAIIVYVCVNNLNHFQLQGENRRCLRIAMEATVSIFGDLKKKACAAGSHDFSEPFPHLQPSPPDACAYTCVCVGLFGYCHATPPRREEDWERLASDDMHACTHHKR